MTLSASITPNPSSTTVAGTVQFKDEGADIGNPVTVANGTASSQVTLGVGKHELTAVFTSTAANVSGSTSKTVTFQVVNDATTTPPPPPPADQPEEEQQEADQLPVKQPHVKQGETKQFPGLLLPGEQAPAEKAPAERPRHR